MSLEVIWTQILLLIVGLGSAMVVNLAYMPKSDNMLSNIRHEIDELFSVIFTQFGRTLRDPSFVWTGAELMEAEKSIDKGVAASKLYLENQVIHPNEEWTAYFLYAQNPAGFYSAYDASDISGIYDHAACGNGGRFVRAAK